MLIFLRDIDLIIFFLCNVLFWHWYQGNIGFINKFCSVPSFSVFWKSFRRNGVNPFQNVFKNSPVNPTGHRFFGCCWEIGYY